MATMADDSDPFAGGHLVAFGQWRADRLEREAFAPDPQSQHRAARDPTHVDDGARAGGPDGLPAGGEQVHAAMGRQPVGRGR